MSRLPMIAALALIAATLSAATLATSRVAANPASGAVTSDYHETQAKKKKKSSPKGAPTGSFSGE